MTQQLKPELPDLREKLISSYEGSRTLAPNLIGPFLFEMETFVDDQFLFAAEMMNIKAV